MGLGRRFVSIALAAGVAFGSGTARADPAVGQCGRRPAPAQLADDLMKERRWVEAALLLDRVAARDGSTSQAEAELASLRLAVMLRQLGYPNASFATISLITSQPRHSMRQAALSELAMLVAEVPEASEAAERLTLYSSKSVADRLDVPATRALFWRVNYRMGRYLYRAGQLAQAIERLGYVDPKSPDYAAAQYLIGMCRVEQRQSAAAIRSLERAERALAGAGSAGAALTDLTRLGLGRLHYAAAFRPIARGELGVDPKNLGHAIKHFGRVDVAGPHAPRALVEQAWAWFVLGQADRALGNLRTLQAPPYAHAFVPDTDLLRAAVHWEHCDRAGAAYLLTAHQQRALVAMQASERVLKRYSGEPFLRFAKAVRANRSGLASDADRVARSALMTREIDGHFAYLDSLAAEQMRFRSARPSFRASALGQRIEDSLKLARDLAERSAGAAALARYADSVSELRSSARRAGRLLERSELARVALRPPASDAVSVVVYDDEEHVLWPFDGEYWNDEIGSYRERVATSCGADRVKWALR
jgi:tetratricopeptide (TPR) repeat protein